MVVGGRRRAGGIGVLGIGIFWLGAWFWRDAFLFEVRVASYIVDQHSKLRFAVSVCVCVCVCVYV